MPENGEKKKNVFSVRNYRLTFFGALVSGLGALLYSFAVSFYILEISSNNAFLQGLYLFVCGTVQLVFTLLGGVLGDRFNKGRIMAVCDYLKGGLILLTTLLMLLFKWNQAHIVILFVFGVLGSAVSGVFEPASGALLPHIVEEVQLQQANAYFSARGAVQSIFGVVLAGILYAAIPVVPLFLIVGLCYIFSGVSEMFIRYEHRVPEERLTLSVALSDLGEGVRYLRSQKAIMTMMAAILFINFFFAPVSGNFIPFFVKTDIAQAPSYLFQRFLTPELWYSLFCVLFGLSSLISSILIGARPQREKCGRRTAGWLFAFSILIIAVAFLYWILVARGLSLNAFLWVFAVGAFIIGFVLPFVNIPFSTVLMRVIDRDKLSKVNSILSIFSQGLIPIASAIAGAVLQYVGSAPLLFICAGGFLATALFLLLNKQTAQI